MIGSIRDELGIIEQVKERKKNREEETREVSKKAITLLLFHFQ
jgi:hypothetical protein